jgi:hypothetical protein
MRAVISAVLVALAVTIGLAALADPPRQVVIGPQPRDGSEDPPVKVKPSAYSLSQGCTVGPLDAGQSRSCTRAVQACAAAGQDAGPASTLTIPDVTLRWRCTARGSDMCLANGEAVTSCTNTAPLAPAQTVWLPSGAAEELPFSATSASTGVDAGNGNLAATVYVLAASGGSGCLKCEGLDIP